MSTLDLGRIQTIFQISFDGHPRCRCHCYWLSLLSSFSGHRITAATADAFLSFDIKPANSGQQTYRVELVEHLSTNIFRSSGLASESFFYGQVTARDLSKTD